METESLNLTETLTSPLPGVVKGLAPQAENLSVEEIPSLNLKMLSGDLPLPVAVLKETAMNHNIDWMQRFTERANVSLCPHGKTTMAPQLFERQLQTGSWGITAATAAHVRTYRQFGVNRILLANQLVGESNIQLVVRELKDDPELDFYCLVDSHEGLAELVSHLKDADLAEPLQVLLELGFPGGRTGVRSDEDAVSLGRAIKKESSLITLRGIEGYEGIISTGDIDTDERRVIDLLKRMGDLAVKGCQEDWFGEGDIILSAGGTSYFDLVTSELKAIDLGRPTHVVIRSGCYLTHDTLHLGKQQPRMRERSAELWGADPGLENALEVWGHVHSVPETHRALCGIGRRDVSFDVTLPQPLWWFRPGFHSEPQPVPEFIQVTDLNDQHAYVDSMDAAFEWLPGDMVGFGIAHPCTTFDKWALMYQVDDDYRVTGAIRTYF